MLPKPAPCDRKAAPMFAKVWTHCASKSAEVVPSLAAPTCPAMKRNSDAFTRVICEYCPGGLPRLSGFRNSIFGMGASGSIAEDACGRGIGATRAAGQLVEEAFEPNIISDGRPLPW